MVYVLIKTPKLLHILFFQDGMLAQDLQSDKRYHNQPVLSAGTLVACAHLCLRWQAPTPSMTVTLRLPIAREVEPGPLEVDFTYRRLYGCRHVSKKQKKPGVECSLARELQNVVHRLDSDLSCTGVRPPFALGSCFSSLIAG